MKIHPQDIKYTKSLYGDLRNDGIAKRCVSCGGTTTRMESGVNPEEGYENALVLDISGGYGMFCDPQDDSGFLPGWTIVLCHDCAHEACERLPWLSEILEPDRAHSHTKEYREENPDHYGWDYDMANGTYYSKIAAELFPSGVCTNCGHSEDKHAHKNLTNCWTCSEADCSKKYIECWIGGADRDK